MYIAMNRFKVAIGSEADFEEVWRNRDSSLSEVPGFVEFRLLRGRTNAEEDYTLFSSHTLWRSEEDFVNWRTSALRIAAPASARRCTRDRRFSKASMWWLASNRRTGSGSRGGFARCRRLVSMKRWPSIARCLALTGSFTSLRIISCLAGTRWSCIFGLVGERAPCEATAVYWCGGRKAAFHAELKKEERRA